ncbi:hypothetical protein AB0H97_23545 [Streptomyces sp. NPDC050788]|uniref:hypothetical protein n=1 Tax=Streptomyces sp. NPDC050788 TaxID=3155041 RepID=UPI003433C5D1
MQRFAYNGQIQIAFEDLGGPGGDPLLLLMGLGTSRFWWPDGLVEELVHRGFHVVPTTTATPASPRTCPTGVRARRSQPCCATRPRPTALRT